MGRGDEAFCAGALVIRSAMQAKSRQDFIREVTPSQGFTSTAAEFSTGLVGSKNPHLDVLCDLLRGFLSGLRFKICFFCGKSKILDREVRKVEPRKGRKKAASAGFYL